MIELDEDVWTAREAAHRRRAETFLAPHSERARRGEPHPVWDFLFTYYSLRPRQLRRWHPGFGVALTGPGARRFLNRTGYVESDGLVSVSRDLLLSRRDTVDFVAGLLGRTADRPARFNCFGLHEWAMVYRSDDVRHSAVPLRLGSAGTDAVVESMPLRCSHFDAFRFFTPAAAVRNAEPLSRDSQVDREQPGCVHAGMDLYKWAYKLGPLVDSELLMDCLDLAAAARVLDMCASPYDLTDYGFAPVAVETASGRAEYVKAQQDIAERAAPLRARLRRHCDQLLAGLPADVRA
ncbi:3-methyladenine DNA glycosylase [Mycolicibacterium bacteremicum]|uniref:3-methyladenine DNA glycosylase n=1 Tax=Mycolicibacterium bacteremicum TaxID=564198 RepID=A0A1W9YSS3_MYCBA|nr:3-methyladenine DNA glycosylase [Mycolicibacterium bacteremicum]MCV7433501.1 3-methyladenine DNA glycosylase [Mycolicibacterium bacteremicum]ORA03083.1 3-methyladenine DNA glycosylase [Mycolicibacterium bacteremicum]